MLTSCFSRPLKYEVFMSYSIYDLVDIMTEDRILASLKHAQDTNALLRLDIHVNQAANNVGEDIELMWEVTDGDWLADKDNALGYRIDYITAIFDCVITKSETVIDSKQAMLVGFSGIKVEVDTQSVEGDLYLSDTLKLDLNNFRQSLEKVEKKQTSEGWIQPKLCFPSSEYE